MITVISRWESAQMHEMLEWQMWRQLKGAFSIKRFIFVPKVHTMNGYTFEQAANMPEALAMLEPGTLRVFLEPNGEMSLNTWATFPRAGKNVAFILGNTQQSNLMFAGREEAYRINTPGKTDLYGINAAAIALAYWWGQ